MSFAIITNFHFPWLAHTKTIAIIRNQILLLLCHLKDCSSQGCKSNVWFYLSYNEVPRTYKNSQKKKLKEEKPLYIFLLKALNSGCNTLPIYTTAFKCGALKVFIHVYSYSRILTIFPIKIHLLLSLNSEETQNLQVILKV